MYHSVSDAPAAATRALSVRPAMFGAQLRYLRHQGFAGLTFGELCQRRRTRQPLPARPIVLTFDDGYADFIEEALPIMVEQGFPATVFVTTGWLGGIARYAAGTPPDPTACFPGVNWPSFHRPGSRSPHTVTVPALACCPSRWPASNPPEQHQTHPDDRKDNPTRAVEPGRTR